MEKILSRGEMFFPRFLSMGGMCRSRLHSFALASALDGDSNGAKSKSEKRKRGRFGHRRYSGWIEVISCWDVAITRLRIVSRSKGRGCWERLELEGTRSIPVLNTPLEEGVSLPVVYEIKKW